MHRLFAFFLSALLCACATNAQTPPPKPRLTDAEVQEGIRAMREEAASYGKENAGREKQLATLSGLPSKAILKRLDVLSKQIADLSEKIAANSKVLAELQTRSVLGPAKVLSPAPASSDSSESIADKLKRLNDAQDKLLKSLEGLTGPAPAENTAKPATPEAITAEVREELQSCRAFAHHLAKLSDAIARLGDIIRAKNPARFDQAFNGKALEELKTIKDRLEPTLNKLFDEIEKAFNRLEQELKTAPSESTPKKE